MNRPEGGRRKKLVYNSI